MENVWKITFQLVRYLDCISLLPEANCELTVQSTDWFVIESVREMMIRAFLNTCSEFYMEKTDFDSLKSIAIAILDCPHYQIINLRKFWQIKFV